MLFLIYINDLALFSLSQNIHLLADDGTVSVIGRDIDVIISN
jgi:hypothetical protein